MKIRCTTFKKPQNLTKVQKNLWNLREEMKLSNILGDHKRFVNAHNAFMSEYVAHPKDALTLPPTTRFETSLFSRTGWNMLKVMIKEIFRKRTAEEKELAIRIREINQNRNYYV
ncbi:hypothetical protein IKQ21_00055 [bacterium]|nr:hypothetical protein [bacterium]